MKKRKVLLILLLVLIFTLVGCGERPEAVIDNFMKEVKAFNLEGLGEFVLVSEDEEGEVEEEIDEDIPETFLNYMKDKAGKIEYEIQDTKVEGDKAVSKVKFKYIDGTELLGNTILQFMGESFGLILADVDISDEKTDEMLETIFAQNVDKVEDRFTERTLDIKLIKEDGKWYLEEIEDELLDVMLANFISVLDSVDDVEDEDIDLEDADIVNFNMDETMELATIDVKVNSIEEIERIKGNLKEIEPLEGAKFIILDVDIKNTGKESIDIWGDDFQIIDSEERIYDTYEDTIGSVDNYMEGRTIGAGLSENGVFLYEVPKDADGFRLMLTHADTDEVFLMELK